MAGRSRTVYAITVLHNVQSLMGYLQYEHFLP